MHDEDEMRSTIGGDGAPENSPDKEGEGISSVCTRKLDFHHMPHGVSYFSIS